jgi:V8-like Glu-specific endopeptidase
VTPRDAGAATVPPELAAGHGAGARRPGVVLNPADRTRVPDTDAPPARWIGMLRSSWPDGPDTTGTATLIGDRYLLTCAHNLYNAPDGVSCTGATFWPGLNRSAAGRQVVPAGPFQVAGWGVPEVYAEPGACPSAGPAWTHELTRCLHDYAVARLSRDVPGPLAGSAPILGPAPDSLPGFGFIHGYSGDLDPTCTTQYTRAGDLTLNRSRDFVSYQMSASSGDDGAPVFQRDSAGWRIVAVHVTGVSGVLNFGPVVTEAMITGLVP